MDPDGRATDEESVELAEELPVKASSPSAIAPETPLTKFQTPFTPSTRDLKASCTGSNCAAIKPPTSKAVAIAAVLFLLASSVFTSCAGDASEGVASMAVSLAIDKFRAAIFF